MWYLDSASVLYCSLGGYLKVTKLLAIATYFLIILHFHRGPGTREGTQQPPHPGVMLMVMDMHWHSDFINDAF